MTTIVIGGGAMGLSIAYGLVRRGEDVLVLDGADSDLRASRGNFGLIWVQGKGANAPHYAEWTRQSARLWPAFASELEQDTGIRIAFSQRGGVDYYTDARELDDRATTLRTLGDALSDDYPFELLDHVDLKKRVPQIGNKVVGGIYSPMDGHVNPLYLLRALSVAVRGNGGQIQTGVKAVGVEAANNSFSVTLADGSRVDGDRVVLAAGLGSARLGQALGFQVPIRPQQGQVLITEKLPYFLRFPSATIRQVDEGGVQIGASKAYVGLDDSETIATTARLARHAVDVFPLLEQAKLIRSWAALRIISPDGLPIYQRSPAYSGASFVACHSGITLSAIHARLMADWIVSDPSAPDVRAFAEDRFEKSDVVATARCH